MIRFLAIITFIFLFLVCTLPLLLVFWLLHKRFPDKIDRLSFAIVQWALGGVTWLAGTEVTVLGKENIPQGKPVLYIGNHTSFFDIIIPYTLVPDLTGYVSKPTDARPSRNLQTFFVNDPTAALKNLPAKIVDKIKVVDKTKDEAAGSAVVTKDDKEKVMDAYKTAVEEKYRFFSFGDAMLIE